MSRLLEVINTTRTTLCEYNDAWGKILTTTGTLADTLGTLNPITYRGYVYDTETGLYYVSSRYYDSVWGRFLNADVLISTGQGLLGNNMFAYCRNNPVCRKDITGTTDVALLEDGTNLLDEEKSLQGGKISNGDSVGRGNSMSGGQTNGIRYTDKVIKQMNNAADLYHDFPSAIDTFVDTNSGHPIKGGDGIMRNLIELPGSINNTPGIFEYIIEPNGVCNHRFFRTLR